MNYIYLLLKKKIVNGKTKVQKDTHSIPVIVNYKTLNTLRVIYPTIHM